MTAVVAVQNSMSHENDKEIIYNASTNNEITQDNGAESKLNAKEENAEMPQVRSLESMGLQAEAEDDNVTENLNAPKSSSKKKSDHREKEKFYCESLLGEITPSQQDAIDRISTLEGIQQMKKWLEAARSATQHKRLGMLLAQCWKAKINVEFLSQTNIGKLVREFKKYPDDDVQKASTEVLRKWKNAVAEDEKNKAAAAKKGGTGAVSKPVPSVSKSVVQASPSVAVKAQASTPVIPKKPVAVSRPKTARTKNTAFRKTGFEEDDEEETRAPPSKKPAPTIPSQLSTPITKSTVTFPKKPPGSAVISNSFMNALSSGSSVNAVQLQKQRKKPPPVIDLPLPSPMDRVAVVTTPTTPANATNTVVESDPNGPDPARVPAPGATRRIHFADDKGEELVLIKYIENVFHTKGRRASFDMKHADAEAERISLKQMRDDVAEEDEDEEMKAELHPEQDDTWRLIPYYKLVPKQFSKELITEEEGRYVNVMRTFISQPDVPTEHPAEPDDVENVFTKMREPENIPTDFVMEEVLPEQEPMEIDAPASPDTSTSQLPTVSPSQHSALPSDSVPTYSQPPVSTSVPVNNFQILNNIDVHGGAGQGQIHPPRQMPVPFPLNPPLYPVPPPTYSRPPPQPVPPPTNELIILADQPSKLNASRLSNSGIDASSILQKLQGKSLSDILGKVKGYKTAPTSNATSHSTEAAASGIPPNFNVPPPSLPSSNIQPVPPPTTEFQILNNIDIHASQAFSAAPRPPGPGMPMMPGGRQQQRPPPGSSGKICTFFLKGTCTFGSNCYNEHRQPQQKPMNYRAAGPQYNSNNRGGASLRGRFNPASNKAPFNSSHQNANADATQDQDNFYRSRKRNDDFRGSRRRISRSPSPRRRRRSRSGDDSPERYRRRRSRTPHSRSVSPDNKDEYRRRRRSPPSRSPSRSPLPSRSPSKSPNRS